MKTFVIGDIHGAYKGLKQCLERSKFNYKKDRLICLGDVADGWPEVDKAFDELMKIKNIVYVIGNHDYWLKEYALNGAAPNIWLSQGGIATINAYKGKQDKLEEHYKKFLKAPNYLFHDVEESKVYVHGGIPESGVAGLSRAVISRNYSIKEFLMWDRELWAKRPCTVHGIDEVFVGHTSIYSVSKTPMKAGNVYFLDTGGGWEGVVSIMDTDSKKSWHSDVCSTLYEEHNGMPSHKRYEI